MATILITGASSGIGAALATEYAAPGNTLYLTGRSAQRLAEVKNDCTAKGATIFTFCCDVRNHETLANWIISCDQITPLDLIIANAGISGGTGRISTPNSLQTNEKNAQNWLEQERSIFEINLMGVINTLHPVIPRMMERQQGHIAIMSSLASFLPLGSAPAYAASKAAVRFYGLALEQKLQKYGTHVSIICPGFIKSPMTDANDFPMPLLLDCKIAAHYIAKKLQQKKLQICLPLTLALAVKLMSLIPQPALRFILQKLPDKK